MCVHTCMHIQYSGMHVCRNLCMYACMCVCTVHSWVHTYVCYIDLPRCTVAGVCTVDCMRAKVPCICMAITPCTRCLSGAHLEETWALLLGNSTNVVNQQTSCLPNEMYDNCWVLDTAFAMGSIQVCMRHKIASIHEHKPMHAKSDERTAWHVANLNHDPTVKCC